MTTKTRNALRALAEGVQNFNIDDHVTIGGCVSEVSPAFYRIEGLNRGAGVGDRVAFVSAPHVQGEIIHIDTRSALIKPYHVTTPPAIGQEVYRLGPKTIAPAPSWIGRVINALGEPLDGKGPLERGDTPTAIDAPPPPAMTRGRISEPFRTGVRVIDLFAPMAIGQRIGVFAGSGVGKSTLMGMFARAKNFDVVVVGLIGERGREVREFLDDSLKAQCEKSIVVVATGDESALMRRLAASSALAIAEFFRDRGARVLLMLDSVTRFAQAAREIAISSGEPPVARGFPPSVFSQLPQLLERAGPGAEGKGAITAIFTVLIDGDDHNDPVADSIRGALDGHIVLERSIAAQGRYPAVNILTSLSRLSHLAWTPQQRALSQKLVMLAARFEETRDLRAMGGYSPGLDRELDAAVNMTPKLYQGLIQTMDDPFSLDAFGEIAEILRPTG